VFILDVIEKEAKVLRRNTAAVRVTSGKKILYQDYFHRMANFCTTILNIGPKKSFLAIPNVENE